MNTVLITGTTSGLGLAVAQELSMLPLRLIQLNRSPILSDSSLRSESYLFDLADIQEAQLKILDSICENHDCDSELRFIVNAATIEPLATIKEIELLKFKEALEINYVGYVACLQRLLLNQIKYGFKLTIANITSGATQKDIKGWASYSISKLAIEKFCRFLVMENPQVSLIEINPGIFGSKMQDSICRFEGKSVVSLKSPSEVAKKVVAGLFQPN